METKPLSNKLYGIIVLYRMHTDFLLSALDGINESDAQKRLDTKANHIAWITGSILHGRYALAKSFGIISEPFTGELFQNNQGIIDDADYPALADFKKEWAQISPILEKFLLDADEDKLNGDYEMPGMKITLFDMISFNTYREANCIGQIALWRRLLGYAGMNYM